MNQTESSADVLKEQLSETIEHLATNRHRAGCAAHEGVTDALIILLRCQRAQLGRQRDLAVGALAAACGAFISGVGIVVGRYFGIV
jgi:hypothetical protein